MASSLRYDGDYGVTGLLGYLGYLVIGERPEVGGLVDSVQYAGFHFTTSVYRLGVGVREVAWRTPALPWLMVGHA